jgi:hypothetical protein
MGDVCEHLEYREAADGQSFEHARPYCTVVDAFVQPMRADVCSMRYGLDPETDCEFYREAHGLGSVTGFDAEAFEQDASDAGAETDGGEP